MDLHLTPAQQLLVNTAREFLRRQCSASAMAESVASECGFSAELWKEISILGWPGLLVSEEYGGSGGDMLNVALLLEEMGRACFPSPYVQSAVVAATLIATGGSAAQRERHLPALARGERIGILALTEESASIDGESIMLAGETGGRLSGRKLFVNDAHVADDLIVATRGAAGLNLFLLDARRPGITVLPVEATAADRAYEVSCGGEDLRPKDRRGAAERGWEARRG